MYFDPVARFLERLVDGLKARQAYERFSPYRVDGAIIGNGSQDFTKTYMTYTLAINGVKTQLIDCPGIEGNEGNFREIIESPWHYTGPTNVHPDGITFYSTLFNSLPDASVTEGKILGGKTGYTDDAGLCLASYAEIGGMEYILVTAGAPAGTGTPLHVEDAQTIYNRLGEACIKLSMRS